MRARSATSTVRTAGGGGPIFLGDFWYWRSIIVHNVYHTANALGVKVGRHAERLPEFGADVKLTAPPERLPKVNPASYTIA